VRLTDLNSIGSVGQIVKGLGVFMCGSYDFGGGYLGVLWFWGLTDSPSYAYGLR
jgi:hypothetical protein